MCVYYSQTILNWDLSDYKFHIDVALELYLLAFYLMEFLLTFLRPDKSEIK